MTNSDFHSSADSVEQMIENLIQASYEYERCEPSVAKYHRQQLGEAKHAIREHIAQLQYEAGIYHSLYDNAVDRCALVAEGFDAACDSPRMKLFVDAGLVFAVYKRDGEIGAAIRELKETATNRAES